MKMNDWQPIETAPRDGTRILGLVHDDCDGDIVLTIEWTGHSWEPLIGDTEHTHWCSPSYWMPKPPSPGG